MLIADALKAHPGGICRCEVWPNGNGNGSELHMASIAFWRQRRWLDLEWTINGPIIPAGWDWLRPLCLLDFLVTFFKRTAVEMFWESGEAMQLSRDRVCIAMHLTRMYRNMDADAESASRPPRRWRETEIDIDLVLRVRNASDREEAQLLIAEWGLRCMTDNEHGNSRAQNPAAPRLDKLYAVNVGGEIQLVGDRNDQRISVETRLGTYMASHLHAIGRRISSADPMPRATTGVPNERESAGGDANHSGRLA